MIKSAQVVLLLTYIVLSGCAVSQFKSIPITVDEFNLSKDEIRNKYLDIPLYEKNFSFESSPPVSDLILLWGKPTWVKTKWNGYVGLGVGGGILALTGSQPVSIAVALGVGLLINPYPIKEYYWLKKPFCIKATVMKAFTHFYRPVVAFWEWSPLKAESPSPCLQD